MNPLGQLGIIGIVLSKGILQDIQLLFESANHRSQLLGLPDRLQTPCISAIDLGLENMDLTLITGQHSDLKLFLALQVGDGSLPLLGLLFRVLLPKGKLTDLLVQLAFKEGVIVIETAFLLKVLDVVVEVGDDLLEDGLVLVEAVGLLGNLVLDLGSAALAVCVEFAASLVDGVVEAANLDIVFAYLVLEVVDGLVLMANQVCASRNLLCQISRLQVMSHTKNCIVRKCM